MSKIKKYRKLFRIFNKLKKTIAGYIPYLARPTYKVRIAGTEWVCYELFEAELISYGSAFACIIMLLPINGYSKYHCGNPNAPFSHICSAFSAIAAPSVIKPSDSNSP